MNEPYYNEDGITIYHADALKAMRGLPDNSIDLIATDPPYFKIKGEAWDQQWSNSQKFLAWIDELSSEWYRVLKPNGSLYCFASPQMAGRIETVVAKQFNILNQIVWNKLSDYKAGDQRATAYKARDHQSFRRFFDYSERIIFAEPASERGTCASPIGSAIQTARTKAGLRATDIDIALGYVRKKDAQKGTELCRRWEEGASIPSEADFVRVMQHCQASADYAQLSREYEDIRREYESLRRPFRVTPDAYCTDVWSFPTVQAFKGKHSCEKPISLMRHILKCSGSPGLIVLDCFIGSGTTLEAARELRMTAIGIDNDKRCCRITADRLRQRSLLPAMA